MIDTLTHSATTAQLTWHFICVKVKFGPIIQLEKEFKKIWHLLQNSVSRFGRMRTDSFSAMNPIPFLRLNIVDYYQILVLFGWILLKINTKFRILTSLVFTTYFRIRLILNLFKVKIFQGNKAKLKTINQVAWSNSSHLWLLFWRSGVSISVNYFNF